MLKVTPVIKGRNAYRFISLEKKPKVRSQGKDFVKDCLVILHKRKAVDAER